VINITSIDRVPDREGIADGAARQIAQLRHVLALIEEIAGQSSSHEDAFQDMARISAGYAMAPAIVQRRFDAVAQEVGEWAEAGVKALVAAPDPARPSRAAARRLADELARALRKLGRMVN
jgi:hypothetical protein